MASARSDTHGGAAAVPAFTAHKILVAGGFGAGKTTLVGAISEVRPLQTEEALTTASIGLDDLTGVGRKTTTTVALDFGRITLGARIVLYLFGMPGQERFSFMWDELAYGALGAVILADVRRLGDCFPSVNYFETRPAAVRRRRQLLRRRPELRPAGDPAGAGPRPRQPAGAVRRP